MLAVIGDEGEASGDGEQSAATDVGRDSGECVRQTRRRRGRASPRSSSRPTLGRVPGAASRRAQETQPDREALRPTPRMRAQRCQVAVRAAARRAGRCTGASDGDATEVTLPALGESVTEGTVTQWLKSVGDDVAVDEPLLEVSTDKVDTEIPSPVAGTLLGDQGQRGRDGRGRRRPGARSAPKVLQGVRRTRPTVATESAPPASEAAPEARQPEQEAEAEPTGAEARAERTRSRARGCGGDGAASAAPLRPSGGRDRPDQAGAAVEARRLPTATSYVTPLVRKLAAQHGVDLVVADGHRRRRSDPQAGRARRRREGQEGRRGRDCRRSCGGSRGQGSPLPRPSRARCEARPRSSAGCAR